MGCYTRWVYLVPWHVDRSQAGTPPIASEADTCCPNWYRDPTDPHPGCLGRPMAARPSEISYQDGSEFRPSQT